MENNKEECKEHKYVKLGFKVISKDDYSVKTMAAMFCEKCGKFKTRILSFDTEHTSDNYPS